MDNASRIANRIKWLMQAIMVAAFAFALFRQQWMNAALICGIISLTALPAKVGRRYWVYIPPEFEVIAIGFIFTTLFLGEIQGYYERFWWWDVLLHTSSGFLLGLVGFLLIFVLNRSDSIHLTLSPVFIALFAFAFSVSMGVVWEIFEFTMDQLFDLNMQKSGLVDTMWDLIVDTTGSGVVSLMGFAWLKSGKDSFLVHWIRHFVDGNPRLFRNKEK